MICPSCGFNNAEDARLCKNCRYKFYFGTAFNDPANTTFQPFSQSGNTPKTKFIRIFLLIFIGIVILFMILSYFK